jgi:CheY-like chemotaxis protein
VTSRREAARRADGTAPARRHVLVADDNQATRAVLERMLGDYGYDVTAVADGAAAVEAARARRFDLVLMDGRMPVLDGCAAARRIRAEERRGRVPIVYMTASVVDAEQQAALEAGMDDLLPKPMSLEELHAVLVRWTEA